MKSLSNCSTSIVGVGVTASEGRQLGLPSTSATLEGCCVVVAVAVSVVLGGADVELGVELAAVDVVLAAADVELAVLKAVVMADGVIHGSDKPAVQLISLAAPLLAAAWRRRCCGPLFPPALYGQTWP